MGMISVPLRFIDADIFFVFSSTLSIDGAFTFNFQFQKPIVSILIEFQNQNINKRNEIIVYFGLGIGIEGGNRNQFIYGFLRFVIVYDVDWPTLIVFIMTRQQTTAKLIQWKRVNECLVARRSSSE